MLHYYGPSGRYAASNVLLSPALIQGLSYQDVNPKTGKLALFVFDGIDFSYYDSSQKRWLSVPVSKETYEKFYDFVSKEQSLENATIEVQNFFYKDNPSKLTIKTKVDSSDEKQISSKIFQESNFVKEGDFYRVMLREQTGSPGSWVYFYHPGIGQEAMQLFLSKL